jgi:hypothetical protein
MDKQASLFCRIVGDKYSVITLTTARVPRGNTHSLFKNLKFNILFEFFNIILYYLGYLALLGSLY